jgi:hypothetical protein
VSQWFRCCAVLVLACVSLAAQWQPTPASKRIQFSGYDWIVKDSGDQRVGPDGNYFSKDGVRVDERGLTLRVFERDGRYYCAEVLSAAHFGYGTYRFEVASNVNRLAADLVLGLFTWSDDPGVEGTHKELDIELSRWGNPENDVGQFVVQPYTKPENIRRFALPATATESTHAFEWTPGRVRFSSAVGGHIIRDEVFSSRIPAPGNENARMNLWISGGRIRHQGDLEVTIRRFAFAPAR